MVDDMKYLRVSPDFCCCDSNGASGQDSVVAEGILSASLGGIPGNVKHFL